MEMMPEAWETMEAISVDELEAIKAMEARNDIEDISDDEEEGTIQLPSNGGQSESGVFDAGKERK